MNIKAIIFDLDGTLLDSISGLADAMNLMLQDLGYPVHPVERYKDFVGRGLKETVLQALPEAIQKTCDIDRLVNEYRRLYDTLWQKTTLPYDGIGELLDRLQERKTKTAVLSNKSDDFTKRMAAALLAFHRFERVYGDREGIPRKPDPSAALSMAEEMGVTPGETVFVGDSGVDMETGQRAGMYPVGVLWGFRGEKELIDYGAQRLIRRPMELFDIMN